jgi:integrase
VNCVINRYYTQQAVLNWAVAQDWLVKSPARKVPTGSFKNKKSKRKITMDEYRKLLDACPNQEWRSIMALARIGGLRCPSELQQLRWADVDFESRWFLVKSPKTERHNEQDERQVPLFPDLREELEKHFSQDKGNEFVIQGLQGSDWKLYDPFQRISEQAGLGRIRSPFRNMRRSRSNEVMREHGSQMESLWIGHSEKVMEDHYFELEDEDFLKATER